MTVQDTFTAFQQLIDADADCTTSSMEVMERININATNKYANLVDSSSVLDVDREYLRRCNKDIKKYCSQVDELDEQIKQLEQITKQVDEWSKELEVKSRRLKKT